MTGLRRKRRIALYGGTFGPPHDLHALCAEAVYEDFDLDEVHFVTSNAPPNKPGLTNGEDRHELVIAQTANNLHFIPSRIDLDHNDSGYSLIMVEFAQQLYGDGAELFYPMGAEYIDPKNRWYLPRWIGASELMKLCTFLVFPRNDADTKKAKRWAQAARLKDARIKIVDIPSPNLSSTMVRQWMADGRSIRYVVQDPVRELLFKPRTIQTENGTVNKTIYPIGRSLWAPPLNKQPQSIGVFLDRFDPINTGDLGGAEWARETNQFDVVEFVTLRNPPHMPTFAPAEIRQEMVVAATASNPYFRASSVDVKRQGTTSYELLSIERLRAQYGSDVQISVIVRPECIDPKSPRYLPSWVGGEDLLSQCRFVVLPTDRTKVAGLQTKAAGIPGASIEVMSSAPTWQYCAGWIRNRVRSGKSARYATPDGVVATMHKQRLYKD